MLLAVDIGNTNITLGLFEGETLRVTARLATEHKKTADQYAVEIRDVMDLHGWDFGKIDSCMISSVVPDVGNAVLKGVERLCRIRPLYLEPGTKTGLSIRIDNPAQLGADLVAGAVGARHRYPMPCIIIDMGTATTLSVLDENGVFLGGTIAAGVRLTLKALAENTSQLPSIHIEAPKSVIGRNTEDSMKSGLVLGTAAMLDGLIDRTQAKLGRPATVVATGGLSREIIRHCTHDICYDENLLLDGLRLIYEKNRPQSS